MYSREWGTGFGNFLLNGAGIRYELKVNGVVWSGMFEAPFKKNNDNILPPLLPPLAARGISVIFFTKSSDCTRPGAHDTIE